MEDIALKEIVANAIKWIDGLATTKEKQGRGMLGNGCEGFCCLGFGCSILNIDFHYAKADNAQFMRSVGLRHIRGEHRYGRGSLIDYNDNELRVFKEISNILKEDLNGFFIPEVAQGLIDHYKKS